MVSRLHQSDIDSDVDDWRKRQRARVRAKCMAASPVADPRGRGNPAMPPFVDPREANLVLLPSYGHINITLTYTI